MNHSAVGAWDSGIEYAALTDIGLRRNNNQDSFAVQTAADADSWQRRGHLFIVADGMGGHAAGELASKMAADNIPLTYSKLVNQSPSEAIRAAIEDANSQIHTRGQANIGFHGMGTTSSVLLLRPEGAMIAHVGDSRIYRLRQGQFQQLTFDHSLVWEMMFNSQVPADDLQGIIPRNVVTRSLGPNPAVQVDLEGPFPVEPGDMFLMCSDGLSGQVKDEELGAILSSLSPQEAVQALVDLANLRGGPDNITVIVVRAKEGVASHNGAAAPVRRTKPGRIHPAVYAVIGVGLLFALVLSQLTDQSMVVFAVMGLTVGIGILALVWSLISGSGGATAVTDRFGRGPYTNCDCRASSDLIERLARTVTELREAAADSNWQLDWKVFNAFTQRAEEATTRKETSQAVREYCQAISFMMNQIRGQHGKQGG
jgi:protein phosphatase